MDQFGKKLDMERKPFFEEEKQSSMDDYKQENYYKKKCFIEITKFFNKIHE